MAGMMVMAMGACACAWGSDVVNALNKSFSKTLEIGGAECAGMSAFRKFWDKPIVVAEDGERRVIDEVVKDWGHAVVWGGEKPGPLAFHWPDALSPATLLPLTGSWLREKPAWFRGWRKAWDTGAQ